MFNFGFRGRSVSNVDNDFIREANLQIELMHSELEHSKQKERQLEEENTKLRYKLNEASKQRNEVEQELEATKQKLKILVSAFEPMDTLHRSLNSIRKSIGLGDLISRSRAESDQKEE